MHASLHLLACYNILGAKPLALALALALTFLSLITSHGQ